MLSGKRHTGRRAGESGQVLLTGIIMMLILRVGGLLNTGYEQIFLMRNDLNMEFADVFDTYIYTRGIVNGQYSFSTAAGLFKSIVGMILVLGSDKVAKLCGESGVY